LPVVGINSGDRAIGIFQEDLVIYDIHHYKTATRLVAVDATDTRLLFGMLSRIHSDVPSPLRGN
jgi:hypothetical protein